MTSGERQRFVDRDGTEVHVATYYGRPVLKEPAWTWEVPWYLFAGGLAGASSLLTLVARVRGHAALADRSRLIAGVAAAASPPLLIADLGRPSRFLNMLRVFKPTSVMSVGSWILAAYSGVQAAAIGVRHLDDVAPRRDRVPRGWVAPVGAAADSGAAVLGLGMATYTGALVADTAIPVWHEAREYLPPLFAASGLAAAGAAATLVTPSREAAPARRAAVLGAGVELALDAAMRRRLGPIGEVYEHEEAGRFHRFATALTATGGALLAVSGGRGGGRLASTLRRTATVVGAGALLAGGVATRWAVYRAGFQSARDPVATLGPQRARIVRGERTRGRDATDRSPHRTFAAPTAR